MNHYSEDQLERYRNGSLSFLSRILCWIHLRKCSHCREIMSSLECDDLLIQDLRNSLNRGNTAGNEKTYRKLCKHFHTTTGSTL